MANPDHIRDRDSQTDVNFSKDLKHDTTALPSRSLPITVWVLRILVAALFLFTSFMKLSGQAMMVQEFDTVGLGQWFRYFTESLELLGAVVVLVPRVSVSGAILLLLVVIGAFVAQITVLNMDWVHTIVIGLFIAALISLQRQQLIRPNPRD